MSTWRAKVLRKEVQRLRAKLLDLTDQLEAEKDVNVDLARYVLQIEAVVEETEDNLDAVRNDWYELGTSFFTTMKEVADICSRFGLQVTLPPLSRAAPAAK